MHPRYGVGLALRPTNEQTSDFLELTTKAHNMDVTIASCCGSSLDFAESKKDKAELRMNANFFKNLNEEAMPMSKAKPVRITKKSKLEEKKKACLSRMQQGVVPR